MTEARLPRWARLAGLVWGLAGLAMLLLGAIWRLSIRVVEDVGGGLTGFQAVSLVVIVFFMGYSEGYRGFQKSFSPRAAVRALHLRDQAQPLEAIMAPFFLLNYMNASKRQKIAAYALTVLIVACIAVFSYLPPPWRGILDAGVVVGLAWGTVSLTASMFAALSSGSAPPSEEEG